ncbi:MAG: PSD1 and planctomycete cytochrome C domain-containing protein [Planctomycetaceae bacterium]
MSRGLPPVRFMIPASLPVLAAVLFWCAPACGNEPAAAFRSSENPPSFKKTVRPILKAKCYRCHGKTKRKGELDLRTSRSIETGGESGRIIDRNSPRKSTLYEHVRDRVMPPKGEGRLTDREISILCRWIEAGAKLPGIDSAGKRAVNQHDVMPILQLRCAVCHGLRKKEAGLDVRTRASLLKGGKSGPAIVVGKPKQSLILKRIHAGEMPPRRLLIKSAIKPIAKTEVETLTRWIAAGAPETRIKPDVATTEPDPLVSGQDRQFWAFQPPTAPPVPNVRSSRQVRTPVDAFILRRLEKNGLSLSPEANRYVLIRRAYFDLIGLPPSPQDVRAFVADRNPNAYERLIDRLLSSPQYGERWGQYWLDLAGYSDSEGVVNSDPVRKHAYRYRDYVIRAFNADKPYSRFLMEQLAGDELARYDSDGGVTAEVYDNLVATGFLRMAPDGTFARLTGFVPDRLALIDSEIEIFGSAVLGLTIKCARCHSHKFDPIPQRDYYRLLAIFKGALDENDWLSPSRESKSPPGRQDRLLPFVTAGEIAAWKQSGGKKAKQPLIRALWDRGEPSPTYILKRGNYLTPGRLVGPGVPSVLTDGKTPLEIKPPWPGATKTGRRLALAKWIIRPDHPLTARVIVNRIWKHHFRSGIVKTLDNFGKAGARPTHPELLDWLAVEFVRRGWSLKSLHRLVMTSAVYRQSSRVKAEHERRDPPNVLLSRMPLKRLEAEVVRDSLLHIAGELNLRPFGPADGVKARRDGLVTSVRSGGRGKGWRRSIYTLKRRTQPLTILRTFDAVRLNPNCVERRESIVATQALFLKNNRMLHQLSAALADRIWKRTGDDPTAQIRLAYRLTTGRPPSVEESRLLSHSLGRMKQRWEKERAGTRHELFATKHLWVRETEPDRVFEDDLISVWSKRSSDKGRRYGLVEFDVRSLAGLKLSRANLELGVLDRKPIRQSAASISPGIDKYTWRLFQKNKAAGMKRLAGLGRYVVDPSKERIGQYAPGNGATPQDLRLLENAVKSQGRLTLVLMADEDKRAYRRDWDDGVYSRTRNLPPRLVVYDSRPDKQAAARKALQNLCRALINSAAFLHVD